MTTQKTISKTVSISGVGLHTGKKVTVKISPADENDGVIFFRSDLQDCPAVPAYWSFVSDTHRATSLANNQAKIKTVEHFLAAVFGLGITNLRVETDSEELPVIDGSGKAYHEVLSQAEIVEQNNLRSFLYIDQLRCGLNRKE